MIPEGVRMNERDEKRARARSFLTENGLDALFLTQVGNFAWYTNGREPVIMLSSDRAEAGILITPEQDYIVCNSIEYPRMREEDLLEQDDFKFIVTPWQFGAPVFADKVHGKHWATDWPLPGSIDLSVEITRLRYRLTPPELVRYRQIALDTAQAIEAAARQVKPGMTEMEIAGLISAQALQRGITPTLYLVGSDERIFRYRHPIPTLKKLEKYAMMVICGRRWGLTASATRFVHFGKLPDELDEKQKACAFVDVTFNSETVAGAKISTVFQRAVEAYAQVGFPGEWQMHNQGGSAGYMCRDYDGTPTCEEIVQNEQGFAWNPSITGIKFEDTVITHADGVEFITNTREWPVITVNHANRIWNRPAILVRD